MKRNTGCKYFKVESYSCLELCYTGVNNNVLRNIKSKNKKIREKTTDILFLGTD